MRERIPEAPRGIRAEKPYEKLGGRKLVLLRAAALASRRAGLRVCSICIVEIIRSRYKCSDLKIKIEQPFLQLYILAVLVEGLHFPVEPKHRRKKSVKTGEAICGRHPAEHMEGDSRRASVRMLRAVMPDLKQAFVDALKRPRDLRSSLLCEALCREHMRLPYLRAVHLPPAVDQVVGLVNQENIIPLHVLAEKPL